MIFCALQSWKEGRERERERKRKEKTKIKSTYQFKVSEPHFLTKGSSSKGLKRLRLSWLPQVWQLPWAGGRVASGGR